MKKIIVLLLICLSPIISFSQSEKLIVFKEFKVGEAKQGVAVDSAFIYIVNNSSISKISKKTGNEIAYWFDNDSILHHLNSGIIIDGRLYCCNSNYPEFPMASSIEIFDPITLNHIDNHSFGIFNGSATWVDKFEGCWYVAFAHYTGNGSEPGKDNSWSRLVKFDENWRQLESWIFPKELIIEFENKSNSGGVILPTGSILCTGHDNYKIYLLEFPEKGFTLKWVKTIPVGSYGQGIAYEKFNDEEFVYGIIKNENKVMVSKITSSINQ